MDDRNMKILYWGIMYNQTETVLHSSLAEKGVN